MYRVAILLFAATLGVNEDLLEASRTGDLAAVSKPPIHWDAAKGTNVVWKVEIPGLSVSSPIVWGDRVYVTTAISSDPTQKIRTIGEPVLATPAWADDLLIVRGSNHLFAIAEKP